MSDFPWLELILAVIGVLVTAFAFLWEFVFVGRKRLGYRVQMDTIPTDVSAVHAGAWGRLDRADGTRLVDPSFVLLRVENIGATKIDASDYAVPPDDPVGIRVRFPGRSVAGIVPTELSDPTLAAFFAPPENGGSAPSDAGRRHAIAQHRGAVPGFGVEQDVNDPTVGVVTLPRVTLNPSVYYKILVVLERAGGDGRKFPDPEVVATIAGGVGRGRIKKTESRTGMPRWVTVLIGGLVCVSLAEPFALSLLDHDVPLDCAGGTLTLVGSTAFGPVLREAAGSYEKKCPDANFVFDLRGSVEGLRVLDDAGRELAPQNGAGNADADGPPMLAFSDGAKEGNYPKLLPRPIAFPLFTLVVNREAGVEDLSLEQIRQIYNGRILDWSEVGGNDLPVRLVGRSEDSGTRKTFERQVLNGTWEPARNSDDCLEVARGAPAGVVQCERPTTGDVLNTVAATPGAIGYSELGAASGRENLLLLRIGGHEATLEGADYGAYPFWETEYAYTYGQPAADSLPASFLRYLTQEVGMDIIRSHGHRPCAELENPVLCRPT